MGLQQALNPQQIKLIQTAVRGAGLRVGNDDSRYRLLLRQYNLPNGKSIESCKQLNREQMDDLLRICVAMGWKNTSQEKKQSYRRQCRTHGEGASLAQIEAIMQWPATLVLRRISIRPW